MTTLEEFKAQINAEKDRLITERDAVMKEKGLNPFLSFEEGTTRIKILPDMPKDLETKFGTKKTLNVEFTTMQADNSVKTEIRTIVLNDMLYRDIIGIVANGEYTIDVTRTGAGKETRYKVKPVR